MANFRIPDLRVGDFSVTDLGSFLREQRVQSKMSIRQLAELAGVSNPYLSQVERGLRKPSAEVLQQIARALHISSEALYVRAGLLQDRREAPDTAAVIAADPLLTARQQHVLVELYRTFLADNNAAGEAHQSGAHRAQEQ